MMNIARENACLIDVKKNISFSVDISDNFKNKSMTPSKLICDADEGERVLDKTLSPFILQSIKQIKS